MRKITFLLTTLLCVWGLLGFAQKTKGALPKIKKLAPGTYYIINSSTSEALTPGMGSAGQNIFLQDFTRDGLQQWKVIQKGKQYAIQLEGHSDLLLQPHPTVRDHTPILNLPDPAFHLYSIDSASATTWFIRSVHQNGNALHPWGSDKELRFSNTGGSKQSQWEFRPVGK